MNNATLYDVRDLDLMLRLNEGDLTAAQLADAIGMTGNGMASRLAWMRRFGFVEREAGTWGLTAAGSRIVRSKLLAAQTRAIESVPEASLVEVMAHVTVRYREGDVVNAHLLRREFMHGTGRRSWR